MKRTSAILAAACLSCLAPAQPALAQVKVVVASETWGRVLYLDDNNEPQGAMVDFVGRMNRVQNKFRFEVRIFPRLRLDSVFIDKQADVYPLRTTLWTKPALGLLATRTILSSGDVYIARRDNRYGGAVFSAIKSRRVVGVRGYHYGLFNNNTDEAYIRQHFDAYLLPSNDSVIQYVLADRADVGIVPELIMADILRDPAMRAALIVGAEFDSRVELSNLVRKDGPIKVAEMDHIIELLARSGEVGKLRERLGVGRLQAPAK